MNSLMNLVYLAIAIVIVSGVRFSTAQADVVSPRYSSFSTHTHTALLVTQISHASLVFSLAPYDERPVLRARGPVVLSSPPFPPP